MLDAIITVWIALQSYGGLFQPQRQLAETLAAALMHPPPLEPPINPILSPPTHHQVTALREPLIDAEDDETRGRAVQLIAQVGVEMRGRNCRGG
jgi:hypothetical protein